jgi:hypothetical protein
MRKLGLLICLLFTAFCLQAQELLCEVKILDNQIQLTDKRIFRTLEQALTEFMNTRKWTEEDVKPNERIECNIQIIMSEYDVKTNHFKGAAQVQARRPIFGSSYNTQIFNLNDENWDFTFVEFQPMIFNDNSFSSNLTSLLAFYAYYIIGMDMDSYGLLAGTPYFVKAFQVVNNAQPTGLAGWQPFERNLRSRFNLTDNVLNDRFRPQREAFYKYHRLGLDQMIKDQEAARKNIYASLELVKKVFKVAPNTVMLIVFFEAKGDELVNIYKGAPANEKPKVVALLSEINPGNISKYEKIQQN